MINKDKRYKVYVHINKINNKMYVGLTSQTLEKRSGVNGCGYKQAPKFYKEIEEFGWENFEHIILKDNLTRNEGAAVEREYIKLFATQDPEFGYNTAAGGFSLRGREGLYYGKTHSEETKAVLREIQRRAVEKGSYKDCQANWRGGKNPKARAVYCIDTGTVYPSLADAAKAFSTTSVGIMKACKGKIKTTKGHRFMYADDERLNAERLGRETVEPSGSKRQIYSHETCVA